MRYLCLRKCFVGARLWHEGVEYELPDDMEISPKNFEPVVVAKKKARVVVESDYFRCPVCQHTHRETSKVGRNHKKKYIG